MNNKVLIQPYRDISIKIYILDYKYTVIDELSGVAEDISFSNDSTSDIRRTASISMVLDSGYTNTGVLNERYFSAGNGFWFDKYLRIDIGIENEATGGKVEYIQQGTYLINEPSVTYNATDNTISFQAVDLMSKLTGMRSGNMQGIAYEVPAGSIISDVIASTLREQGFYNFVLGQPEEPTVPYDIKIESGGTSYDLLSQLRDINPNWEIFFDVDGTFVFQKIPSGEIIDGVPEYSPTVVADDDVWDRLLIDYNLSTSFEQVKNYIEVYGKTIESDDIAENVTVDTANRSVSMTCSTAKKSDEYYKYVLFTIGDTTQDKVEFTNSLQTLTITDGESVTTTVDCTPNIWYNNMTYVVRVGMDVVEYLGYQQPCAVAWENNDSSPFYVGDAIELGAESYTTPTDKIIDGRPFSNIVRVVMSGGEYDNIYSNQLAIDRAVYELYQQCRLHDQLNITCVPIYSLDSNQIISMTLPNEDELSYWIIKSVNTDFSVTGTQTINAMRYYAEYPSN